MRRRRITPLAGGFLLSLLIRQKACEPSTSREFAGLNEEQYHDRSESGPKIFGPPSGRMFVFGAVLYRPLRKLPQLA